MTTTTSGTPTATSAASTARGAPDAASDGTDVTAGGGIDRLNAFDGLFLRAEHLTVMQDYARDLATAVGAAGGAGVVEGFELTLDSVAGDVLHVGPGLAVDPSGRPLRSGRAIQLSLKDGDLPPAGNNGFWWIVVRGDSWGHGDAAVTGTVCDEPCAGGGAGGTAARLYQAEGVRVSLEPDVRGGLDGQSSGMRRRPWLASVLFAEERSNAGGWPGSGPDTSIERSWTRPLAASGPSSTGVRLGVLLPMPGKTYQLDAWAARRDVGAPPPTRAWQWSLGMRPWDVFVAQVSQFQSTLAENLAEAGYGASVSMTGRLLSALRAAEDDVKRVTRETTRTRLAELRSEIARGLPTAVPGAVDLGDLTLATLGFADLPPAGYLPCKESTLEGVASAMRRLFGDPVNLRVCACRPVDVAQAFQEAQHRDRVLLDAPRSSQAVDVLVPFTDGPEREIPFDWVAFVRRDGREYLTQAPAPATTEPVAVYLIDDSDNRDLHGAHYSDLSGGTVPALESGGEARQPSFRLTYPAGGWSLPADDDYPAGFEKVQAMVTGPKITVFALVSTEERMPLGTLRAAMLCSLFSNSLASKSTSLAAVDVVVIPDSAAGLGEAIVVLKGPEGD